MDPVGPWQFSYNRLAAAGVQGATGGDLHHHFAQAAAATNSTLSVHNTGSVAPSTTSQLLLQAAHSTPLGGSSAAFNHGTFLTPPAVGYDSVFSPLFHHASPKPAHFNAINAAQHRQVLAQAQAAVTKQVAEADILRENYQQHHQTLAAAQSGSYFDHTSTQGGGGGSGGGNATPTSPLTWQGNNQLPSPFGILPHESVVPSSPGPPTTKSSAAPSTAVYENFNAHFANQPINHVNAILKTSTRAVSPQINTSANNKSTTVTSAPNSSNAYYQSPPSSFGGNGGANNVSSNSGGGGNDTIQTNYATNSKQQQAASQQQQQDQYGGNSGKNNRQNIQTQQVQQMQSVPQQQQQQQQQQPHSHQSAVVSNNPIQQQQQPNLTSGVSPIKLLDKKYTPTGPGAGFMGSYLKFLQGERDTSPPPINRSARKGTWNRTPTNVTTQIGTTTNAVATPSTTNNNTTNIQKPLNQVSNGLIEQNHLNSIHSNNQIQQPINQQQQKIDASSDDPRFYSMAKDRKRAPDDDIKSRNKNAANATTNKKGDRSTANTAKRGRQTQAMQQQQQQHAQQQQPQPQQLQQQQQQQPPPQQMNQQQQQSPVNQHPQQQQQQQQQQQPQQQPPPPPPQNVAQYQTQPHLMQQAAPQMLQQPMYYQQPEEDPLSIPIRRETSHRKAKSRSIAALIQKEPDQEYDQEEPLEFVDSDSDPAWTPQDDKDDDEDIPSRKKFKKNKSQLYNNRNKSNILSAAVKGAGIGEFYSSDDDDMPQQQHQQTQQHQQPLPQPAQPPSQQQQPTNNQTTQLPQNINRQIISQYQLTQQHQQTSVHLQSQQPQQQHIYSSNTITNRPTNINVQHPQQQLSSTTTSQQPQQMINTDDVDLFKPGDFVVNKSELVLDWPCIWRVDGKNLLQKYEPFSHNGKMLYRNMATYAAWTPENKRQYHKVPIRMHNNNRTNSETFIEFLRHQMTIDDSEMYIEKMMHETSCYQDNFEVYIQTLISQALDANFLAEIMQEQDDYFLSNVQTIDEITHAKKRKLHSATNWPKTMSESIETWPCYNIITDIGQTNIANVFCVACHQSAITMRLILYGHPYNPTTVESIQVNPNIGFDKDLLLCRICVSKIELYHKVAHQKYLMYIECARHVAEKNTQDPTKASTIILNELLADDLWLAQLFKNVRRTWAEVDYVERQHRFNLASQQQQ